MLGGLKVSKATDACFLGLVIDDCSTQLLFGHAVDMLVTESV